MANPIETVSQFAALIELMKDPTKFSDLVDQAKKLRDDNQKIQDNIVKLQTVNDYVDKAQLDIGKQYDDLEKAQALLDADIAQFKKDSTAKGGDLALREEKVGQREANADLATAKVVATQKLADKTLKDAQDLAAANNQREYELDQVDKKLKDKATQLAALMGT